MMTIGREAAALGLLAYLSRDRYLPPGAGKAPDSAAVAAAVLKLLNERKVSRDTSEGPEA